MSAQIKAYVGDGAYVALDEFGAIIITTENGYETTNRVVLEPEYWRNLLVCVDELRRRAVRPGFGPIAMRCQACGGTGVVACEPSDPDPDTGHRDDEQLCPQCNGEGA